MPGRTDRPRPHRAGATRRFRGDQTIPWKGGLRLLSCLSPTRGPAASTNISPKALPTPSSPGLPGPRACSSSPASPRSRSGMPASRCLKSRLPSGFATRIKAGVHAGRERMRMSANLLGTASDRSLWAERRQGGIHDSFRRPRTSRVWAPLARSPRSRPRGRRSASVSSARATGTPTTSCRAASRGTGSTGATLARRHSSVISFARDRTRPGLCRRARQARAQLSPPIIRQLSARAQGRNRAGDRPRPARRRARGATAIGAFDPGLVPARIQRRRERDLSRLHYLPLSTRRHLRGPRWGRRGARRGEHRQGGLVLPVRRLLSPPAPRGDLAVRRRDCRSELNVQWAAAVRPLAAISFWCREELAPGLRAVGDGRHAMDTPVADGSSRVRDAGKMAGTGSNGSRRTRIRTYAISE